VNKKTPRDPGITLLGLGPGDPGLLTQAAMNWLGQIDTLFLRTRQHPTVAALPEHLKLISFDDLYDQYQSFEDVYETIVARVLALGQAPEGVTYAVPGHPFVAEATCPEIHIRAKTGGIPVGVIDGLSFLEPTFRVLGIDPFTDLILMDALQIGMRQTPGFPPSFPTLVAQIYSREVASNVKLTLMSSYPDEHPVSLVHGAGSAEEMVEDLPLYAIDHSQNLGLLSSLYITPLSETTSFEFFQEIIARLRAPDGCPWDREQTHLSLRPFLLEETYETLDALDRQDMTDLEEELGDLLLQILLHTQIATEEDAFNIHHVIDGIGRKLIRRHPHVFSELEVSGVSGVIRNWEAIKAEERGENGASTKAGLLDGVPRALPSLSQAQEIIDRVGRVDFKMLSQQGSQDGVLQKLDGFGAAEDEAKADILGELLMGISALAYNHGVDAESALRKQLAHFRARFDWIEARAENSQKPLSEHSSEELAELWALSRDKLRGEDTL
jgi:tetrapyrrole methylase family protein / MazG family protein